jgi:hypothetical protein
MVYSEKGKPGEIRGRKANGSTVTKVTMIARPPKNNIVRVTTGL